MIFITKNQMMPGQWQVQASTAPMTIGGGEMCTKPDQIITEDNAPGLKLVLMLGKGEVRYRMLPSRLTQISGPAIHLSLSDQPFTVTHSFHADSPLQYVAIRMPQSSLMQWFDTQGGPINRFLDMTCSGPFIHDAKADPALQALAKQLLLCPLQGALRDLYLSGKALELTANVLARLAVKPSTSTAIGVSLRHRDLLYRAQELLMRNLNHPPSLDWLASQVGLSVTLLTRGFRQLFGMSIYEFVREQRLQQAYRMLATGEYNVSATAGMCGYTDSHFSKAFQKRFGIAPHKLCH
ncbi:helix-turn-helix transcriptional regulator [Lampropedia aestuarii]|uniref:helix-turn-helix transcriptional regulator n=1 Tax=Lampropedia aestuarii TaxID=2562762 RepID=UPI00246920EC|nr:AraC family transcriptional regulator [Lampropedia aestuarii]MDH5857557.1 AraC family transcriptional regulator [Lampropedia aestuarii]